MRRQAQFLLVMRHEKEWNYPRAQFHDDATIPCLPVVMRGLAASGPWVTLEFLITPDNALGGLAPREALLLGGAMRAQVLSMVRSCSEGEGFG